MAQEPLNESFFRDVCLNTGMALICTDENLRIVFLNTVAARLLGETSESMIGQPVVSIVPEERRELAGRLLERALAKGEISEFDFRHRMPDGEPAFLAVTFSPIITNEQPAGVSIGIRNVTRRIHLEHEMAESRKMSALGTMAGAVAHHLNNILGGIITSVDFVHDSTDPIVLQRVLRNTADALTRINKITHGLLAFAEGDHTNSPLANLRAIVEQFVRDIRQTLANKSIDIQAHLEDVDYSAPTRHVLRIMSNLVSNAADALPKGGAITVELKPLPEQQSIVLRVTDTGGGIPDNVLPHVFEPFFTTKTQNTAEVVEHSGLGLAVVHGLVKVLGGTIIVSSCPQGTTFSITLPLSSVPSGQIR